MPVARMSTATAGLSEDFNRTAEAYARSVVPVSLLMAKYSILMNHKAQEPEEREALTQSLYNVSIKWLRTLGVEKTSVPGDAAARATTLFSRLTEPGTLPYLPHEAAGALTDAGLAMLNKAELIAGADHYQCSYLIGAAEQTLLFADKIKAYQDSKPPVPAPEAKKTDERLSL